MRINEKIRGFAHGLLADTVDETWPLPPPEGVEVPQGMVWVGPGPFVYGAGEDARVVRLEEGFFAARSPVTNQAFARFVEATEYVTTAEREGGWDPGKMEYVKGFDWRHPEGPGSGIEERMDHPVVQISWLDATAYAEWAGVRLLTEREWEKAARGIDGRLYPWGDTFDRERCNTMESRIGTTTPVGQYSPAGDSPCGCVDMAGNAWEWTASPVEPDSELRVLRGGAFDGNAEGARAPLRIQLSPRGRDRSYGMRVAAAPFSPHSELCPLARAKRGRRWRISPFGCKIGPLPGWHRAAGMAENCRVLRGGAFNNNADNARASYRNRNRPNLQLGTHKRNRNNGVRVAPAHFPQRLHRKCRPATAWRPRC
jgi:formylglycine-generating enzyme required for sulfatase activity